jgi:hypothetical protein
VYQHGYLVQVVWLMVEDVDVWAWEEGSDRLLVSAFAWLLSLGLGLSLWRVSVRMVAVLLLPVAGAQ